MTDTASRTRRSTICSTEAEAESDPAKREQLYQEANRKIMAFVASVPYAHNSAAIALESNIQGFVPSPVGVGGESFATVEAGEADDEEDTPRTPKPRPRPGR